MFSVLSYLSVMYSLLQSVGNPSLKPVANIGIPFNYYFQFWVNDSDFPNNGWIIENFIYDVGIIWVVVTVTYFVIKRKITKKIIT